MKFDNDAYHDLRFSGYLETRRDQDAMRDYVNATILSDPEIVPLIGSFDIDYNVNDGFGIPNNVPDGEFIEKSKIIIEIYPESRPRYDEYLKFVEKFIEFLRKEGQLTIVETPVGQAD